MLDAVACAGWDDVCGATLDQMFAERLGIIPFVGDHHAHLHTFHQSGRGADVGVGAGGEQESDPSTHPVAEPVELGVGTTPGGADLPLFAVGDAVDLGDVLSICPSSMGPEGAKAPKNCAKSGGRPLRTPRPGGAMRPKSCRW